MTKLQDKQVAFNQTLIIPKGSNVTLDTDVGANKVTFQISFSTATEKGKSTVSWTTEGNIVRMSFINWENSLGTALKKPVRIGSIGNVQFGFIASHSLIGEIDLLHFQVLVGGNYE